jgi:hypothetical protein
MPDLNWAETEKQQHNKNKEKMIKCFIVVENIKMDFAFTNNYK